MDFPHDTDLQRIHRGELARDKEIETLRARVIELERVAFQSQSAAVDLAKQLAACEIERDIYLARIAGGPK